ncbi:MAG: glutathione-disulfide reductase [Alphaproteobacteria bacterium]|nr:glutathione-disulfide reductase [Alphaproteobacteria bacterium]
MSEQFDLVVIGGGSGGVRAARMAAGYGAKVCVIEEYRLGGTCVIRGCVPKKLFVYASRFHDLFQIAPDYGWSVDASFDWPTLLANKDREIARLEGIYGDLLAGAGVDVRADRGVIEGPNAVRLQNADEVITTRRILVATGGRPVKPGIKGAELGITSNEAFHLEQLPKSILIEGGGYVAVEFASVFVGMGVDTTLTTLIYRRNLVLRGFDDDLRQELETCVRGRGLKVRYESTIVGLNEMPAGVGVDFSDGEHLEFGAVMFATGRAPNVDGLGLETCGVILTPSGAIEVDEYSQSTCPTIYAVGDVTGRAALTPVAIREGAAFAETVYNANPTTVDHSMIPTAVFTEPEAGTVGLNEDQAVELHRDIDVYIARFRPMINTLTDRQDRMMFKLITLRDGGRVLGCHIIGNGAAEMIQLLAIPLGMGASKADFDRAIAVHPTAAEELVTFKAPSHTYRNGERVA